MAELKVGDMIQFGKYDWRVLDVQDGKALLLTDKIIVTRRYRDPQTTVTWAECPLRGYLNNEFYHSFNPQEKERIVRTKITTDENPWWPDGIGVDDTVDRTFLLSIEEVVKYFGDSGQLENQPKDGNGKPAWGIGDEFSEARIAVNEFETLMLWWLRSPGCHDYEATFVNHYGDIHIHGSSNQFDTVGVRPALWLALES